MPYEISEHNRLLNRFEKKSSYIPDKIFQGRSERIASSMADKVPQQSNAKSTLLVALLLTQIRAVQNCQAYFPQPHSALTERPPPRSKTTAAAAPETYPINVRRQDHAHRNLRAIRVERHNHRHDSQKKPEAASSTGSNRDFGNFFSFPMALASPTQEQSSLPVWDAKKKIFTIQDENTQNQFFSKILNHLVEQKAINTEEARAMEFEWRQNLDGQPLHLTPTKEHSIGKRRSFQAIRNETLTYIKQNCVIETKIVTPQGSTVTEPTIFYIDEWEKFLTWPDSYLREKLNGPPVSTSVSTIFDSAGFVLLLGTRVVSMAFLKPISDWAKQRHYTEKGDNICRMLQNREMLEHAFSTIEVGSLGKVSASGSLRAKKPIFRKPPELRRVIPVESNAIFYAENKQTGTQTELLLKAKKYTGRRNQYEDLIITEQGPSRYIGHRRSSPESQARSRDSGIQIEYDDLSETWREIQPPHLPLLNVELQSGRTFVTVMGERYTLHMAGHNQYQIAVRYPNGRSTLLPVYRDRISRSWHLKVDGQRLLFSPADESFIQQLKIETDQGRVFERRPNDNPAFYANAEVIRVSQINEPSSFTAVEMNGEIVPVQKTLVENHGIRYDTRSLDDTRRESRTLVWDGDRWSLEGATSRYITTPLKKRITSSMYASNVDIPHLSAPDQRGIRWDRNHNGYLKVKNQFVQLFPESRSTLLMPGGAPLPFIFQNGKYHLRKMTVALPPFPNSPDIFHSAAVPHEVSGTHDEPQVKKQVVQTMAYFLENIWAESFENEDLYLRLKSYLETDDVKVEQVPSSQLQTIRTIISAKGEITVLDTSPDNKRRKILAGAELELALSKYHKRKSGGDIRRVVGLVQNLPLGNGQRIHTRVLTQTHNLMKTGSATIKSALDSLAYPLTEKMLVLGNDDFLGEGSFASNACADPQILYEALVKYFIPLSHAYPNAIIAPGTIYISQGIPDSIAENHLRFELHSRNCTVAPPLFFTAIIAPVFHNGKIVTIARKGEYLEYDADGMAHNGVRNTVRILHLDDPLPSGKLLISKNEDRESMSQLGNCRNTESRSIISGKTLLSGEEALVNSILRPHMAHTDGTNIFRNDFIVGDDTFLFIIGNEAKASRRIQPSIRKELLSANAKSSQRIRYDWILHASTGEIMDPELRASADNYLQIDSNEQSAFKSQFSRRTHALEFAPGSGISMYRYDLVEKN